MWGNTTIMPQKPDLKIFMQIFSPSYFTFEQEEKILNASSALYRFNNIVFVILSGLIGNLYMAASDLGGQEVSVVASVIGW